MTVCCVFSLEPPHRDDSNEYTQHTIINLIMKITSNYPKYNNVCIYGTFLLKIEKAVVNKPSVFEPPKFYCTYKITEQHCYTYSLKTLELIFLVLGGMVRWCDGAG